MAAGVVACSGSDAPGGSSANDAGAVTSQDGSVVEGDSAVPVHNDGPVVTYGDKYEGGQFNLGPVDYDETKYHNACAPQTKYSSQARQLEGDLLAGLWNGLPNIAADCDSCIYVTTAKGKTALLRVVTYGDTSTNSIDVSPSAFAQLDTGEYPRAMTWQFAKCPDTGKIIYEFQTGSSEYWTSFWVRNARVPIAKVEAKSKNHDYLELSRGTDGTLSDGGGFGKGDFTIRITGIDGSQVIDPFPWPASGIAGQTLTSAGNFQ